MFNRIATGGIAFMLLLIVLDCLGTSIFTMGDTVLFGWLHVVNRIGPRIEVNYAGVASGIVCIAATVLGLHYFSSWIYREVRRKQDQANWPATWRWKWTLCLLAAVMLMFLAGLVGVGLFRTTSWFLETPRFFENRQRFSFRGESETAWDSAKLCSLVSSAARPS